MAMWPMPEPRPPPPSHHFRPPGAPPPRPPSGPPPPSRPWPRGPPPPPPAWPGSFPSRPPPGSGAPIIVTSAKPRTKKERSAANKGILAWTAGKSNRKSSKNAAKPGEPSQPDIEPAPRLRGGSGRRSSFLDFTSGASSKSARKGIIDDGTDPVQENAETEPEATVERGENEDGKQEAPLPSDKDTGGSKWKGKQPDRGTPMDTQPPGTPEEKATPESNPDKDLIMAYLFPTNPGEIPPLQPRRTLDQYFYTHLENTSQRDADQVVYRYTLGTSEAKIFMVDQLWLWILNEDVVISCFPQRWQSEVPSEQTSEGKAQDTKPKEAPPDREVRFTFPESSTSRAAEQSKQASRDDNRSIQSSVFSTRKSKRSMREDSMDVKQTILKYLESKARAQITDIYELANLIANSCVNVFDQYSVPDAFQFLEFFERSIGNIADQEARCLQEFTDSLGQEKVILDIKKETAMLVEIKDISDELDILKIVLDEQKKTLEDMDQVTKNLTKKTPTAMITRDESLSLGNNRVLESHLYRIEKMKKMTEKSHLGLQHLLDLKQKQANFSEALSARKQSENTYRQAELAREIADRSLEQARLARRQAELTTEQTANTAEQVRQLNEQTALARDQGEETARQGKTMMMFTVVTIIFLPMSFMAAFFTLSLESFPFNGDGRMPLSFVLKYILSISGALSIPFITVAFQQERISKWYKIMSRTQPPGSLKEESLTREPTWLQKVHVPWASLIVWMGAIIVVALGIIVPITLVWTRPLAPSVKIAVTVALLFIGGSFAVGCGIYKLVLAVRSETRSTSSGSSSYSRDD